MAEHTIGGYQILGELGRGAMGVVYQAHDQKIDRPVALKVIRVDPGATAEETANVSQRLVREAGAAGKLSHPGIVTVHQLGWEGADVYVVMELVRGSSLERALLSGTHMDLGRRLDILRQIAEALDYAHRSGIVHRDVKPANILLRDDGCVKVADFGIAKMTQNLTQSQNLTSAGTSLGSPAYMSPEQIRATPVDGRSDEFSLAIIAFQMLSGRMPFVADTAHALMYQIVAVDPFAGQPSNLPPAVASVLARALAKSPADRFPSCSDFIQQLANAANVPLTSVTYTQPMPPQAKSTTRLMPVLLVLLIVALAAGGGYWYFRGRSPSVGGTKTAGAGRAEVPLIKAIYDGKLDEARRLLASGADINEANDQGITALMQAAEGTAYMPNSTPAVAMLLDKGAAVDAVDLKGRTALFLATMEGKDEAMALLIAHKANVNQRSTEGATPIFQAVYFGKIAGAKMLIEKGADIEIGDAQQATPLMIAAEGTAYMPNNAPLVTLLLEKGAKVDSVDVRGRGALYRASAEGKIDAMTLLLDKKANPNLKASDGTSPLYEAAYYGKLPGVQLLLARGAEVDSADSNGATPLIIASEGNAYMPNNAPMVETLLAANAKVEAADNRGRTALFHAAVEGKEDAMRILLDKKANGNVKENDGATPLFQTVYNGKLAAARLLVDRGVDVNLADANGTTPLMVAAEGTAYIKDDSAAFVSLLLSHKANREAIDGHGKTALQLATEGKNDAAIALLKR